jgi:hypothetical protein
MKKRTRNEHGLRHITPAEPSVFCDLGFDEAEARVLEMRADLMAPHLAADTEFNVSSPLAAVPHST